MLNAALYFHTLRYLRPVQVYGRLWHTLYRPEPDTGTFPRIRPLPGAWRPPVRKTPSLVSSNRFRFLNEEHELRSQSDWNRPEWSQLWLFNLHYFDDLNAVNASERTEWHRALIKRWVAENSHRTGNGWESYPLSLRIVNWIKWALAGNELPQAALESLVLQTRFLGKRMEYHLLGNHLFANAKALTFAGCFFEGKEADHWLDKGIRILSSELPEQILHDGGQFERSPMYHALTLEDMLDLINITEAYGTAFYNNKSLSVNWRQIADRMRYWMKAMCHPDGEISFFNDAAMGIAPTIDKLEEYASHLGLASLPSNYEGVTYLAESGYIRVQRDGFTALLDVAPLGPRYLPAHGHADTLSFELSWCGQRVMVNSGISCYGKSDERHRQRGTAAHNTVVIDHENSSEVWGGFRVGRRANVRVIAVEESMDTIRISAYHDGYMRLPGKNIHRRDWIAGKSRIVVRDEVSGSFGVAEVLYHLHPAVIYQETGANKCVLHLPNEGRILMEVDGGVMICTPSTWHPMFGCSERNNCIMVKMEKPVVKTVISLGRSG